MNKKYRIHLNNIFETVIDFVLAQGGDGDGLIICRDWIDIKEVAGQFESFLETYQQKRGWSFKLYPERHQYDHHFLFSDGSNENIVIVDQDFKVNFDKDNYDIIVRI